MGESNNVEVRFGVNLAGLVRGMSEAASTVREGVGQINGHLGSLQTMAAGIGAAFAAVTAVLAGGAIFKSAISETVEWTKEQVRVARALGITTEQASVLSVALDHSLATTDQYLRGVERMTRQINQGGKAFADLGIKTRDSSGHLRPATELMADAIEKLNGLKSGTDRNVAAQALFGRGWMEIMPVLKLTREEMEHATTRAAELGLVVGPEGAAQVREYRVAMVEIHEVMHALQIRLGRELMPTLTKLAEWFGSVGPSAVARLGDAIKVVVTVFSTITTGLYQVASIISAILLTLYDTITTVGSALYQAATGNFSQAWDTMKQGATSVRDRWVTAFQQITDEGEKWSQGMAKLWGKAEPPKKSDKPEGGSGVTPAPGPTDAERAAGLRAFYALQTKLRKDTHDQVLALLTAEEDAEKEHDERRLAAAQLKSEEDAAFYGKDSAEAIRARQHVADVERQIDDKRRENRKRTADALAEIDLAELDAEEQLIRQRAEKQEITAKQELAALEELERRKYEIRKAAIEDQLADDRLTAAQRDALLLELERLEVEHNGRMAVYAGEHVDRMRQLALELVTQWTAPWQQGIAAMLNGTLKFSQAVRGIFTTLRSAIANVLAQMASDWIAMELKKFVFFIATKLKELIFHQSAEKARAAATAASATAEVGAKGATAAAGAASSAAAIPYVGWAIAIGAAAAVLASVLAFRSNISSAAGGWDIGSSTPGLAQLHKREMVLPAELADRVRDMTGGGSGGVMHAHFHNVADAGSVETWLRRHDNALVRVIAEAMRNGRAPRFA